MEINENTYIFGYWFASDGQNDWYMMITKEDDKWSIQYTHRYHIDDDPFSDKDKKSIYNFKLPLENSEEEVLHKADIVFDTVKKHYNYFNDSFLVKGNSEKFIEIAQTKDYMHWKEYPNGFN